MLIREVKDYIHLIQKQDGRRRRNTFLTQKNPDEIRKYLRRLLMTQLVTQCEESEGEPLNG